MLVWVIVVHHLHLLLPQFGLTLEPFPVVLPGSAEVLGEISIVADRHLSLFEVPLDLTDDLLIKGVVRQAEVLAEVRGEDLGRDHAI